MLLFAGFGVAVLVYVSFLAWCFLPLVQLSRPRWAKLRAATGALLLAANVFPPFSWPLLLPVYAASRQAGDFLIAVVLFPRTLPAYVRNIVDRENASSVVVETRYPIEIAGARYALSERVACARRRLLLLDKGIGIVPMQKYPTAVGEGAVAQTADGMVTLDNSLEICRMALRGRLHTGRIPADRSWVGIGPKVQFVRGQADETQIYALTSHGVPVTLDDVTMYTPEIVRIEEKPASDTVSLDAMWPMQRSDETGNYRMPRAIAAYRRPPVSVSGCVDFISPQTDFATLRTVGKHASGRRSISMPADERRAYCKALLDEHVPRTPLARLDPVDDAR